MIEERLTSGRFISGSSLAREASVSRTAIFKQIESLRRLGYSIESSRSKGYRLVPRFDGLLPLEVTTKLDSKVFGSNVFTLEKADSTQNSLRSIAEGGGREGVIVIAMEQTHGKGRLGREWLSPKGGLWFSLLLRPKLQPTELHKLTLLFGLAVARCLDRLGLDPRLRWPNDVLIGGRKVCGILMEVSAETERINYVLVGIGVNANFSVHLLGGDLPARSTTLMDALERKVDRALLLANILGESERLYGKAISGGFGEIIRAWKEKSCTIGSRVTVTSSGMPIRGVAEGLDQNGFLAVRLTDGRLLTVSSGDVHLDGQSVP
jgi:BirA family biotin operon repressor/biotin-[acetyl-CoA-carboxylase] ligase